MVLNREIAPIISGERRLIEDEMELDDGRMAMEGDPVVTDTVRALERLYFIMVSFVCSIYGFVNI